MTTESPETAAEAGVDVQRLVLRICSAHKTCPIEDCRHKQPHECDHVGMHRFHTCHTSGINSACLKIEDGTIPVSKWKKCDHCGHSEFITEREPIFSQNAELSDRHE